MQKKLNGIYILPAIVAVLGVMAFGTGRQQHDRQKENKGQQKKQEQKGKPDDRGNSGQKGHQGDHGQPGNRSNTGNNNNPDHKGQGKGRGDEMKNKNKGHVAGGNYHWTPETFKDRGKWRKQEKVTVCHKFRGNEPGVTLSVSANALQAHLNHGDVRGECTHNDGIFSDIFSRRRSDYYNNVQQSEEQLLYSRSVLDYALERLAYYRLQRDAIRNANAPAAAIAERDADINSLEQNVSLLEVLVGGAAALLMNKL